MILRADPALGHIRDFPLARLGGPGMVHAMRAGRQILLLLVTFAGCISPAKPEKSDAPPPNWDGDVSATMKIAPPPPLPVVKREFNGSVALNAPSVLPPGQDLSVRIDWRSAGAATIREPIPDGVQLLRSDPAARLVGRYLEWDVPGSQGSVTTLFRPARVNVIALEAEAVDSVNASAVARQTVRIGTVRLDMQVATPSPPVVGSTVQFYLSIANKGQLDAQQTVVHADLDPNLARDDAGRAVDISIGTLAAGQTRTLQIPAIVNNGGRLRSVFTARADGCSAVTQEISLDVPAAKLTVAVSGPSQGMIGQLATWNVEVKNAGSGPAKNATAQLQLPPGLVGSAASNGGRIANGVVAWPLGTLPAGAAKSVQFTAIPNAPMSRTTLVATARADATPEARGDRPFEAVGSPIMKVEFAAASPDVEVGKTITYTATIRNTGSLALENVEVAGDVSPNLAVMNGFGPTIGVVDGSRINFARIGRLDVGQIVVFRFEAQGKIAGDARVSVTARSTTLPEPIRQEEATRVAGAGS